MPLPLQLIACLSVCFCLTVQAQPQTFRFEHLTVQDGLPEHSVFSILQDHLGFLWLGTGNGLVRYDGYTLEVYLPDPDDPHSLGGHLIVDVFEDEEGRLWVSTTTGGLSRYERATDRFTRFQHDPGDPGTLSTNAVGHITSDGRGHLWVDAHMGGMNRVEIATGRTTRFRHDPADPGSLSEDLVTTHLIDRSGILWVGTRQGLNRFEETTGTFKRFRHDPQEPGSLVDDAVRVIAEDSEGGIWIGTASGVDRFEPATSRFVHYGHQHGVTGSLSHGVVRAILVDQRGTLWIGTDGGLSRFEAHTGTFEHYLPNPGARSSPTNSILHVYEDRTGLFWIRAGGDLPGTEHLYSFEPESGRFTEHRDHSRDPRGPLLGGGVRALYEDHAGILWMGSWMGGVSKLDRSTHHFRHYPEPAGPGRARNVLGVNEDGQGRLWVATGIVNPFPHDSGLHFLDRGQGVFTHHRIGPDDPQQTDLGFVKSTYEDRSGRLWITGGVDLRSFDPTLGVTATYKPYPEAADLLVNHVLSIAEDRSGRFWVGTYAGGLFRFDPDTGTFTHRYQYDADDSSSIPADQVNAIYEDRRGHLWLGTARGITQFHPDTGTFTRYYDPARHYFVRTIHEDAQGQFWLAAWPLGLCRFDPATGALTAFGTRYGLANNSAHAVLEDDDGFLWVSTARGLSRFDPVRETFRNYFAADGLGGDSFSAGAAVRSVTGELFFGGKHGLNAFLPAEVRDNPYPPRVVLTGLRIFDHPVLPAEGGSLHAPIYKADEVRVGHHQNHVTFEFVGLHFSRPSVNQYAYMLEGYDADWRTAGTQRTATYMNLAPGSYTFRARAANADGIWNEDGVSVQLVVVPPWWQRAWARMLAVLGLLAVAATGYRLRVRRLAERARSLEMEVDARTRELVAEKQKTEAQARRLAELDEAKSRFFANISHEFRTPLTLLLSPLDEALEGTYGALPAAMQRQVHVMRRNARRLLRLVGQLLDLSKLEAGEMTLSRRRGDLVLHLRDLVRSFTPLAERRRITLLLVSDVGALPLVFDSDAIEKVFGNLLSNALKFTPAGGRVWLTISDGVVTESGAVEVVVKDTGPGIPPEALERIFDRFQQVDASATRAHEGTGLGLALARELVELHGGTLRAESVVGYGSAFTVRLPVAEAPDESESEDAAAGTAASDGAAFELAAVAPEAEQEHMEAGPIPDDGRPAVLVVEDHPDVRALLLDTLRGDYRVLEATDGAAGLDAAHLHRPALIVSDVMMPRMDGFELCRRIKADAALRATPVILLTARAAEADRIRGLEGGADDYIAKPFSPRELQVRVTNLLLSRRQLRRQFSREIVVKPADVVVPSEDEALLTSILEVLERHLSDSTFSVERLADEVGMSRRQVYRRVQALTGEAPAELLRRLRLERATRLLEMHPGTVAEVAYAVGFRSPSHFASAFRTAHGVSPSEYAAEGT